MNSHALLLYMLKSIFISGIFVSYYWIALRNKNFNNYNRFYLLLSLACSVIVPLFNFNWLTIEKQALPVSSETFNYISTQITAVESTKFSWQDMAVYAALLVSLFLIIVMAFNIIRVYRLKRRSAIVKMDEVDFIYTDLEHAPFSFLNNLFWKESIPLDEDYGRKIFKHELTHIRQKHTIDILYCQIIHAIFWMNPFYWLIQKELKAVHEFIADKEAVGNNNVEEFVKLLLQVHYGKHFLDPTHSFYYSSIKRRLFMLTTPNKTKFSQVRKLLVLPVTLLVVAAMSVSTIESKANAFIAPLITVQQHDVATSVQQPVVPSPVQQAKARAQQPKKRVSRNDTVPAPITVIGYKQNKDPKDDQTITLKLNRVTINSTISRDSIQKTFPNVLYYIDNLSATVDEVSKLKPEQIRSINVTKGEAAIKKFGDAGANGVIEIFTKSVQ